MTVSYLLNYYPGIDTEIRDCRGFTALIKAAMTGRTDVVAALVMAGMEEYSAKTHFISLDHYLYISATDIKTKVWYILCFLRLWEIANMNKYQSIIEIRLL